MPKSKKTIFLILLFAFLFFVSTKTIDPTYGVGITILNIHSHPQAGDNWTVSFETIGTADLAITPDDQQRIDDLNFVSLKCDGEEKIEGGPLTILEGDVIFYPDWFCEGTGELIHVVNVARKHTLKFQFGNRTGYAYNSPDPTLISTSEKSDATGYNTRKLIRLSDGTLYATYFKQLSGYHQIYIKHSTDNGSTWTGETRISTYSGMDAYNQLHSSIAVDSNNYLHVVWHGRATGYTSREQIWYAKYTTSWSTPVRISTYSGMDSRSQQYSSIAVDSSGYLHVVWHGTATGYTSYHQIWYAKYTTSWSTPVRISTYSGMDTYYQYNPSIAVDSNNYLHVVWHGRATGYTDNNKVWYTKYTTSWATPECKQATGRNQYPNVRWSRYPSSNIPTDRIDYFFTEGTASPYDIYFAYIDGVSIPTVTTQAASSVEATSCTGNGNITYTGGANCTIRGFCYKVGTTGDPTTADSTAYDTGSFGTGVYTKTITGLSSGTSYRVRAYAVNSAGTGYGTTVQILTKPAAPTGVSATDGTYTDKVTITWTKSTGATGYQVYRDGVSLGWLGDVATYNDTGAGAPTITPGSAAASDGLYADKVVLSLSGQGTNNGATHTYKVRAKNATGESVNSGTNTGYRGVGSLTYQWQRSVADSDANYSNITGATTASYDDTGAPADGSGRYYRCVEDATGATQQISSVDRGYRNVAPTPPAAPTNVQTSDGTYTDKVTITWTKSTGATGYQVYRDGVALGWLGDVATYDDTGASPPTITPGSATASDGTSNDYVALSLSGQSANNGTTHTYKVRAKNAIGESGDSGTDTGYRGVGSLTYQWQRSAADSDASYSNIPGATTASYNDTGAPADGSGRYYRCVENTTGATQQISSVDRGYRNVAPTVWYGAGDYTFGICYEDPSGGSDLDKCECEVGNTNAMPSKCSDVTSWDSACYCEGEASITCPVTISIGSAGDCDVNGEGACKICSKATDGAGNVGYGESFLNIDFEAPETAIRCNVTDCSAGWYNDETGIDITLSCSDSYSGYDETYYCLDQTNSCSPGTLYTGAFNLTTEGINYVRYYSTDIAGNIEPTNSKTIKLDKTGPKSEFTDVATPPAGSTVISNFDVSVNDWDRPLEVDNSGLSSCYYSVYDSGVGYTKSGETRNCNSDLSFTVTVSPTGDCRTMGGTCTVSVYAYDNAGNSGDGQSRTFNTASADTTPPIVTSFTSDRTLLNIANPTVTFNWSATDSGGSHLKQAELWRRMVGEGWPASPLDTSPASGDSDSGTFTDSPTIDGDYEYGLHALDNAGNWGHEPATIIITVDKTRPPKPTCSPGTGEYPYSVTVTCSCTESGAIIRYTTDGFFPTPSSPEYTSSLTFTSTTTLTVASWDPSENRSATPDNSYIYTIIINLSPQLDSISVSPDYVKQGDTITVNSIANDPNDGDNIRLECGSSPESNDLCISDYTLTNPSCFFTSPWLDDATHTIYCRAYDSELYSEERADSITSDNTGPTIGEISPTEAAKDQPQTYTFPVSDASGADSCVLQYVDGNITGLDITLSDIPCQDCLASFSYTFFGIGPHTFQVMCDDLVDNATIRIFDVEVSEIGPLICDINVLDTGIVNQWIGINVSGSQGAIDSIKFSSDNILNGSPDGSWNGPYNWSTSSGNWDATSKIMKWSFAETGNYEVWAEVSDGAETASCYDTITIFECYPGQPRPCISDYGCEHTQACTLGGTWPTICGPIDECTPGEEPQTCWVDGTEGLQTCTDVCTWGPCATQPPDGDGCPWPPPECPICGHPECLTPPVWTCEPEPAGTDCSDCKECDGVGVGEDYCIYQCWEGPQDKCECISDICIDCAEYYDGGCGYQGICFCGDYETPVWSCLDGECQCECIYNEEECGFPPPECTRKNPEVYITPTSQKGATGETLTYTIWVTNQDQGTECGSSTFSLAAGGYCNEPSWTCSLDLTSLTINSGQSDSTILWVTSPSNTPKGDKDISVTAQNTGFPEFFGTGYATYEILNNPPSTTNLSATPIGDCFLYHPYVKLEWSFSDPDLASGDYQSAREVEIFSDPGYNNLVNSIPQPDYSPGSTEYTPNTGLSFNTDYYWRVRVWDNEGALSDCGQPEGWCYPEQPSFHTEKEWPWPDFSVTPPTQRVHLKERVEFTDESTCYDGPCNLSLTANYLWEFGDGETSSEQDNTSYVYSATGNYDVTLTITDEVGNCTSDPITITVTLPLPEWMEIPPF